MLRPPQTTPFPYTTLFRSGASPKILCKVDCLKGVSTGSRISEKSRAVDKSKKASQVRKLHYRWPHLSGDKDRKSTRLNSSHLGISYAVFCLKKKNKQQNEF